MFILMLTMTLFCCFLHKISHCLFHAANLVLLGYHVIYFFKNNFKKVLFEWGLGNAVFGKPLYVYSSEKNNFEYEGREVMFIEYILYVRLAR